MRLRSTVLLCTIAIAAACSAESDGRARETSPLTSDATTTVAETAVSAAPTTSAPLYVLQSGDTPGGVAQLFGLSLDELDQYNAGVRAYQRFVVGGVIWVGPPPTSLPPTETTQFLPTAELVVMKFTGIVSADAGVAGDLPPMFARVFDRLAAADVTVCHLGADEPTTDGALFLRTLGFAGVDLCTSASGPAVDLSGAGVVASALEVNGLDVAVLSYAAVDGVLDPDEVLADVARVRAAGADAVVAVVDWGLQQSVSPTADERAAIEAVTAVGAVDLIVGQAPVLRPVEQVNGVWVAWGLGSMLSSAPTGGGWPPAADDAGVLSVTFVRSIDTSVSISSPTVFATWCDRDGGFVVRLLDDMGDASLAPAVRVAIYRSAVRSRATLGDVLSG
jgi:poly-gamma-glutamate synthesis protein (capsule biosynthesis protein)